ncbi:type VI secretion lipoprotein TssJ [Andreprevotia lacus]|nr:type VI secretion lipoprotein TssJ [Andreprevotia lacus]
MPLLPMTTVLLRPLAIALLCGALALTSGCSSINKALGGNSAKDALAQTSWDYGAGGIVVKADTDAALNRYDGEAHTLVLAVIQTAEAAAFYQLLDNADQLGKLLQGDRPGAGILQVSRYAIEPNRQARIVLDRTQGAKFVGIVAAYYGVAPAGTARLFNLPVEVEKSGIVVKDYSARPGVAELRLKLGPEDIANAAIAAVEPELPKDGEEVRPMVSGAVKLNDLSKY